MIKRAEAEQISAYIRSGRGTIRDTQNLYDIGCFMFILTIQPVASPSLLRDRGTVESRGRGLDGKQHIRVVYDP